MTSELDKVLTSSNWLREMLVAVEHIPICVTVAAASMAMPGFPLLYVNSAFESTTGYTRQEIIGQNCRFLQLGKLDGEVSEQDSINRLSYALREAKPVRVAITNYRKDGTSFSNLLAMKPIMDEVSSERCSSCTSRLLLLHAFDLQDIHTRATVASCIPVPFLNLLRYGRTVTMPLCWAFSATSDPGARVPQS